MAMLRLVIVLFIGLFCRIDAASAQDGRDYVRVIGRPETLAYAADVAEALVRNAQRKYPQLEQSSDEGAIRTFCTTVRDTPDLMLLPQAIEDARPVVCPSLEPLLNLPIGRQVFVVYSAPDAPEFRLTREILFRAMARELPRRDSEGALASFERNPNLRWSEIDPSLPDVPIRLLLPPRRSVQWLAIEDLVMRPGCASIPAIAELALIDQQMASQRCLARRTDFSLNYADPSAASGSQARIPKGTELSLNELRFVPEGMALVAVEGTPMAGNAAPTALDVVRCVATARVLMPASVVRLSAGRKEFNDADQAMAFLAGANSIFDGDRLLTTANADRADDERLFAALGLKSRPAFLPYGAGGESTRHGGVAGVEAAAGAKATA